ncbi:hypothetical protein [Pseudooceanicola sp.]|uniref:hypothetical protein n=1 Tax=Pseudooceanicola sp. TaxID=1914328 RepID=UPI0035C67270
MIIAESIGFAATHSITEILGNVPEVEVSHGSQHFERKSPLGKGSQSIDEFLSSMEAAQDAGRSPVAVHTLFPPQDMKPACDAAGVDYWLLVRDPVAQIESCYAWIARSTLEGNSSHFLQVLKVALNPLSAMQTEASLPNALYYYAVNHVLSFNFLAIGLGAPTRKMEELLSDEAAFREAFAIDLDVTLPHFAGEAVHRASHRSHKEVEALAAPEREKILDRYSLSFGGRSYRLADMQMLLGY